MIETADQMPSASASVPSAGDVVGLAVPRCECCQQALPAQTGRARPRKYCPDGAGRFEAEQGVSCRELGPALELVRRVFGADAIPQADLDRLGEYVTAVQGVFAPEGIVATLSQLLDGVAGQLDTAVAEALTRAERAEAAERTALGQAEEAARLRRVADEEAVQAAEVRRAAERDRDRAIEQRQQAEDAQRGAEHARARAEEARALHEARAERAEEAAARDRSRAEGARGEVATLTATVASLREQRDHAFEQVTVERARAQEAAAGAEQAHADARREIARAAAEIEIKIDRMRTECSAKVAAANADASATIQRQAVEYAEAVGRIERDRATEISQRDTTIAELRHHLNSRATALHTILAAGDGPNDLSAADAAVLLDRVRELADTWRHDAGSAP